MTVTFESIYRDLVPAWLSADEGGKVLLSHARLLDEMADRFRQGIKLRFPSVAAAQGDTVALRELGEARAIPRGRTETDAHYATRLLSWRTPRGHRVRGNPGALLDQIGEYFGPCRCWSIDVNGNRDNRSVAGVWTWTQGVDWTWDDEPATSWSRFWLSLDAPAGVEAYGTWGSGTVWGGDYHLPGYSIGQIGFTFDDAQAIRRLLYASAAWRPAGTQPEWLIIAMDPDWYAMASLEDYVDATWKHWSTDVAGTRTPTRLIDGEALFRFVSLDPEYNNTYVGRAELFSAQVHNIEDPDDELYDWYNIDPTQFPSTSQRLPDGTYYTGNPDNFPSAVRLLDDADPT